MGAEYYLTEQILNLINKTETIKDFSYYEQIVWSRENG
jgi:mannitol/fructose-specific phosphotransferase system IIA component (Ntr-type)